MTDAGTGALAGDVAAPTADEARRAGETVAVLADDLIWATRLVGQLRTLGAVPVRAGSAGSAEEGTARVPGAGTATPSQAASAAWPSSKSFRYANTRSAPAARADFRSAWSSCWPTHRTRSPAAAARRVIATPS